MVPVNWFVPTRIHFGRGSLERHLPDATQYGRRAFVVTGRRFAKETGLLNRVVAILGGCGMQTVVFSEVEPEPTVAHAERAGELCRREGCDCVVAVGGGSPLDAGKVAAVLATNPAPLTQYFGETKLAQRPLPVVAVPTTCGTGSEVTRYAVIVSPADRTKKTVASEGILPALAVVDPDLLDTLPDRLIAATGMDALCHAVEGLLSVKKNGLSAILARDAIARLAWWLPLAVEDRQGDAREQVMFASLTAGLVINTTGTILVHGMGYALTVGRGVHHGTANGLLVDPVLSFLAQHGYCSEVEEVRTLMGRFRPADFLRRAGLPVSLRDIGMAPEEIPELASLAEVGCQRSFRNMKKPLSRQEIEEILLRCANGRER